MKKKPIQIVPYEELENEKLRESVQMSYEERLDHLLRLQFYGFEYVPKLFQLDEPEGGITLKRKGDHV